MSPDPNHLPAYQPPRMLSGLSGDFVILQVSLGHGLRVSCGTQSTGYRNKDNAKKCDRPARIYKRAYYAAILELISNE